MKNPLWTSAEIQADVSDEFSMARNEIEPAMNAALTGLDFGKAFTCLNLIHIIIPDDDPDYKEIRRYHKKDREFEFRLKIDHATFKAADALGQRRLIVDNILRAVAEMRKMPVKDVDHDKLEAAIKEVAASKGWLMPSKLN